MSGTFRPVEVPDLGATMARMAQIDAQRQALDIQRQAAKQEQGFNQGLAELAPALASGQGPAYSQALSRLVGLGPRGAAMGLPMLQQERQRAEAADFWRTGGGNNPPVVPNSVVPAGDYTARMVAMESGGDPNARNPRSTATGQGQFIDGTWMEFARANPELFQGMNSQQILAARSNPDLSRRAIEWYRQSNAQNLAAQGLPANDGTAALAHRFGPQGAAALLRADPNAPIDGVVGPQVMRANPDLAGRTVGQVVGGYAQRFGGGAATPAAPQQPGGVNPAELALLERAMTHPNPQVQQQARARLELLRFRQQQAQQAQRTEQTGPFAGNSMDAQANNIALALADKIRAGTATPQEQTLYQRAYAHLAGGTIQYVLDPSDPTGQRQVAVRVPREMGDLPPPSGGAAPASPTVPTQAGGMTTPAQQAPGSDATPMPTAPGAIPGMERVTPPPAGYRRREDGSMEPIPGGPQDPARQPLTEAQGRSNMFGNAMSQAESILGRVRVPNGAAIAVWRNAPEIAINPVLSANDQQYFNAVRLFAAGILRKETGAAFTAQELLDVQSRFFPMPGDSPQVLAQKAQARQQAVASMQAEIPGGFRGGVESPGPGGRGTAEPPPAPPAGFRIVR